MFRASLCPLSGAYQLQQQPLVYCRNVVVAVLLVVVGPVVRSESFPFLCMWPIAQGAGWAPGPVWTGAENLAPPPGFDLRTVQPIASQVFFCGITVILTNSCNMAKCILVQALRLCTGRTVHRGNRGIALPFLDHGTRRGWGVSVTPRPLFAHGKDPVPIVQEAGWAPGPVWTGAENLAPLPVFDPRTVQPVASRYTNWAIPAHWCYSACIEIVDARC